MKLERLVIRCAIVMGFALATGSAAAQAPNMHYRHNAAMPPGLIGATQLQRGAVVQGYIQPVEIRAPEGVQVSMAQEGTFIDPQPTPVNVGLLIAPVYRLKVTGIENFEGREVFPTIEVIDRLYAPPGCEARFPIPVELTDVDLRLAAAGHYVTRVVYVEDRDQALPVAQDGKHIQWFDAGPGNDPLLEADRLGRPVAILRMGGRLPLDASAPDMEFLHGCPPFEFLPPADAIELPGAHTPEAEPVPPVKTPAKVPAKAPADKVTSRQTLAEQIRARAAAIERREATRR